MLGEVPSGHVAVYACAQDVAAHLGELSVTSLAARGVAGCVLDGGCRDVRFIVELGFPVFSAHVTPEDSTGRWELEATQVPVTVGQVRIEPGDWVVGDDDGVVVVPERDRGERARRGRGESRDREQDPRRRSRRDAAARGLRALRDVLMKLELSDQAIEPLEERESIEQRVAQSLRALIVAGQLPEGRSSCSGSSRPGSASRRRRCARA